MKSSEVKKFYDYFLESRMLKYRLRNGNLRLSEASDFILSHVKKADNVLDIGCGIGFVTEKVADKIGDGRLWACDTGSRNIWYAKESVDFQNIEFFVADVIEDFGEVEERVESLVDVVMMVDVIEHICKEDHVRLLKNIKKVSKEKTLLLLTFPSPEYQRYLIEENPEELQIIDEVITADHIAEIAEETNYSIKQYSYVSASRENQYIHCLLQEGNISVPRKEQDGEKSLLKRIFSRVRREIDNRILIPHRRRKYIDRIFEK